MIKFKRLFAIAMALAMIFSLSLTASAASADDALIDPSKTGSIDIYKYDLSNAEKDGVWDSSYVSTGVKDTDGVENILGSSVLGANGAYGYAIKGVEFTYLKVADIATYVETENGTENAMVLYGIVPSDASDDFLEAIGLSQDERYEGADKTESGVTTYYYRSDVLIDGLQSALDADTATVKSALETYIKANGGTAMAETDEYGHSKASDLPLGLYLMVETKVPEIVTSTTAPFFVSVPMTTVNGTNATNGGEAWLYDISLYPKNLTGMPELEKTVREATADTGKSQNYAHVATASAGDTVEYQILSQLPTISSEETYLTDYTFVDTIASGIRYAMGDVKLDFFSDSACTELIASWTGADGKFNANFSNNTMTITMTEAGIEEINTSDAVFSGENMVNSGYSNCTLRISYSATVTSNSGLVLGDTGNSNEVVLSWKRVSDDVASTLKDDCHVFTYGIDLTKQFSDGQGDFSKVEMILHNDTDNYFVKASLSQSDGVYYVTDHVSDKANATRFVPNANGKILIKGIEDDAYTVTEAKTDSAYTLLRDDINILISTAEGSACEDCGANKLSASATVEKKASTMKADNSSGNALVALSVINTRGFDLPQTGGYGTWMYPAAGIAAMGIIGLMGIMIRKGVKEDEAEEE